MEKNQNEAELPKKVVVHVPIIEDPADANICDGCE